MTVVLPTPEAGQFHAFTQGDELALHAIFRQEYPALTERAQDALGPDLLHASSRVVQQATLSVWRRRSEIRTPEGLAASLEGAVLEEARVQQRKHAALNHRNTGSHAVRHAAPLSADDALAALDAMLHAPPPDHERAVEEAHTAKKHHAAEHVQAVGRKTNWVWPVVMVLAAVVGIVAVQRWVQAAGTDIVVTKALASEEARDLSALRGQRGSVKLGDESRVRIGSESKVRVPKEFGGLLRTLELTGTAHFQVASGKALPFTVRAGNMDIVAVGTAFTVTAFPDDSAVAVMVDEGSVTVHLRDTKDEHPVMSGNAVRIARSGTVTPIAADARDAPFAWTRDSLVFTDAPMSVVVPQLVRWYDMNLAMGSPDIAAKRISARLGLQSSGAALETVRKAAGLEIEFGKDNQVVLKNGTPK